MLTFNNCKSTLKTLVQEYKPWHELIFISQCWVMLTPEPSMTSLGRKDWRWKAGRCVYILFYTFFLLQCPSRFTCAVWWHYYVGGGEEENTRRNSRGIWKASERKRREKAAAKNKSQGLISFSFLVSFTFNAFNIFQLKATSFVPMLLNRLTYVTHFIIHPATFLLLFNPLLFIWLPLRAR